MTYSSEAALQAQAGRDLQMHAEGIQSVVRSLQQQSAGVSAGFAGSAAVASANTLDQHVQSAIRHAANLHEHGGAYQTNSANQLDQDATAQRMIAQVAAQLTGGGISGAINT